MSFTASDWFGNFVGLHGERVVVRAIVLDGDLLLIGTNQTYGVGITCDHAPAHMCNVNEILVTIPCERGMRYTYLQFTYRHMITV